MKYLVVIIAVAALIAFAYWATRPKPHIRNYPSEGIDIIAFGDSLIVGTGSSPGGDLPSLLSTRIGTPIVNLGESGDMTAQGLARLNELDPYHPKVVILLFGGNDYLQHVPENETFANLGKIIADLQGRGAIVLLLGVRGGVLQDHFAGQYERLRDTYETAYVSDVLSGLIGHEQFMSDQVHPNNAGYVLIADRVYPVLKGLLR